MKRLLRRLVAGVASQTRRGTHVGGGVRRPFRERNVEDRHASLAERDRLPHEIPPRQMDGVVVRRYDVDEVTPRIHLHAELAVAVRHGLEHRA